MIRVAIVGYGNLGRGVELALKQNSDMKLVGVFSRREAKSVTVAFDQTQVFSISDLDKMKSEIDVVVLCGGSATDLPKMTPQLARNFNVVDSFDTHAKIPEHFVAVDECAREGGTLALISVGWDPGMFSLNRALGRAILPQGADYTFWGKGVSQGHSDALRRIEGVIDARQYTIPKKEALDKVRAGSDPDLTTREKHSRLAYVVAEEGANKEAITHEVITMPHYFDEYDTEVVFINAEEMKRNHSALSHGGTVLRSGKTGIAQENNQIIEYQLHLDSNPEFTASVLVAYARAAYRLSQEGQTGCKTVFDVAPAYLINMGAEDMRAQLL